MNTFAEKMEIACWIGKSLFTRGKVSGSSANLSFKHGNRIFITAGGSSFGRLTEASFSEVSLSGETLNDIRPSKELPLHLALYQNNEEVNAVIHTHSTYATYWSCLADETTQELIPSPTPYLKMKVGKVNFVPYAPPGSEELFEVFRSCLSETNCYLLGNHGPILGDKSLLEAFYAIEELEEASKNAWLLKNKI